MEKGNFLDISPMVFPTGRKTRVMIGQNGQIKGSEFCQGYVEIDINGSIPMHNHETVESYTILEGKGLLTVDEEESLLEKGDFVFIEPWQNHSLKNTGNEILKLIFVYAPQIIVDHWDKERKGIIK